MTEKHIFEQPEDHDALTCKLGPECPWCEIYDLRCKLTQQPVLLEYLKMYFFGHRLQAEHKRHLAGILGVEVDAVTPFDDLVKKHLKEYPDLNYAQAWDEVSRQER